MSTDEIRDENSRLFAFIESREHERFVERINVARAPAQGALEGQDSLIASLPIAPQEEGARGQSAQDADAPHACRDSPTRWALGTGEHALRTGQGPAPKKRAKAGAKVQPRSI